MNTDIVFSIIAVWFFALTYHIVKTNIFLLAFGFTSGMLIIDLLEILIKEMRK